MYNDKNGMFLVGHHHKQQYHRENGAFIVETLRKNHSKISQHPYGNEAGKGLTKAERSDWDKVKKKFNKERAKEEFLRRGGQNEQ